VIVRVLSALLVCGWLSSAGAADPLPALGASREQLTVSGLSSGAFMAVQFQIAHSRTVAGAGIIAGGPYYCAEGLSARALANCMAPTASAPPPSLQQQRAAVDAAARRGEIDSPTHLRDHRVWLFSGASDHTVQRSVVDALAAFYETSLAAGSLRYVRHPDAGHAMISPGDGQANACATSEPPFINRCQTLDAAGELLAQLVGPLKPKAPQPAGELLTFDQRPFVPGAAIDASMADGGYVYVPGSCRTGGCRIHVAYHGCRQSSDTLGTRYVTGAGYNAWADSNRLVVLYPQVRPRYGLAWGSWKFLLNPNGCWDWWGYSGADYASRNGKQIRAVEAMIDQLVKPVPR
jgi:poly(3-hydroxybutyrate) depolymerase